MSQTTEIKATPTKYSWDQVLTEAMSPLLDRQYISGAQSMVARIFLKKGCVVPTHSHANEQISYILSGALEMISEGVTNVIRAGDLLVIPGNVPHSAHALEDTVNIDFFTPPRQDWIDNDDSYLRQPPTE
jgi:quercetin dioxygenase-like cupin family protein